MIEVEHLTKYYGGFLAVDDISFTIEDGHVYAFLGPNGAGKSTTMNIIIGCLSATAGRVRIDGHDIYEEPDKAKRLIGYLPEHQPLYLNESPREYLRFVGEAKGLRGEELQRQIAEVVEKTGIAAVQNRRIAALSKGYRVGIAQALLGNPRVIILDEPTVGLDPLQIIEIRDLIRELGKTHTVIFSSHILSEVQAICDEILMIAKGRLAAFDTPENLEKELLARNELRLTTDAAPGELRALLAGVEAADTLTVESEPPPLHGRQRAHQGGGYLRAVPRGLSGVCRQRPCPFGAVAQKGHAGGCLHRRRGGLQHGHRRLFRLLPRQQSRQTRPHRSAAV